MTKRKVKNKVLKAKLKYKNKLEAEFAYMYTWQALQKVNKLTGSKPRPNPPVVQTLCNSPRNSTHFMSGPAPWPSHVTLRDG